MTKIQKTTPPADSFMQKYERIPGCSVDAFTATLNNPVTLEQFITAFFDSPVFKLERFILKIATGKPTTRQDVENLAVGKSDQFAMWKVESRSDSEILMAVGDGPIRSWLALRPGEENSTHLYFGSAVLPEETDKQGNPQITFPFRALGWFHEAYSRVLLWTSAKRISFNN